MTAPAPTGVGFVGPSGAAENRNRFIRESVQKEVDKKKSGILTLTHNIHRWRWSLMRTYELTAPGPVKAFDTKSQKPLGAASRNFRAHLPSHYST